MNTVLKIIIAIFVVLLCYAMLYAIGAPFGYYVPITNTDSGPVVCWYCFLLYPFYGFITLVVMVTFFLGFIFLLALTMGVGCAPLLCCLFMCQVGIEACNDKDSIGEDEYYYPKN